MPHALWTGSISFGLVSIPVGLYPATEDHTIHFHQFEAGTSDRIHYARLNQRTGEEVPFDDIVKGYELGGGETVLVTPEELDEVSPERSSTIEISDFVDLTDIDPIFFRSTYYLAPKDDAAAKPYKLLMTAMDKRGKAGISRFVMRNKEHLCTVRADRGMLVLETMYFADEIRDPAPVLGDSLHGVRTTQRELQMAMKLIDSLESPWRPDAYHDTYAEDVEALLARKQKGEDVVVDRDDDRANAPVIDLMTALEQSVDRRRRRPTTKAPRKMAPKSTRAAPTSKATAKTAARPAKTGASATSSRASTAAKGSKPKATPRSRRRVS
jgi:DNA end-binding protein Ku